MRKFDVQQITSAAPTLSLNKHVDWRSLKAASGHWSWQTVQRDVVDQRQAAWDFMDRRFKPEELFGAVGADVVRGGAARASAHEFGYSYCLQASLLGCVNGASIAAWPGKPSPLSLVVMHGGKPAPDLEESNKKCDEWDR